MKLSEAYYAESFEAITTNVSRVNLISFGPLMNAVNSRVVIAKHQGRLWDTIPVSGSARRCLHLTGKV